MEGLNFARVHINNIFIISKGSFEVYLKHIEKSLTGISVIGLKVCMAKARSGEIILYTWREVWSKKWSNPWPKKLKPY